MYSWVSSGVASNRLKNTETLLQAENGAGLCITSDVVVVDGVCCLYFQHAIYNEFSETVFDLRL